MNQEYKADAIQPIYPQYISAYVNDDEISLVDLWVEFLKYKKIFLISFITLFVLGVIAVTNIVSPKYNMSSVIRIGSDSNNELIETPASVIKRINLLLLPAMTKNIAEKENISLFKTRVSNPKGTNLVVIENAVTESDRDIIAQFQNEIVDTVISDHKSLSLEMNRVFVQQLESARLALKRMENPLELVKMTKSFTSQLQAGEMALFRLTDETYLDEKRASFLDNIRLREEDIQVHIDKIKVLEAQRDALKNRKNTDYEISLVQVEISNNRQIINKLRQQKMDIEQEFSVYQMELEPRAVKLRGELAALESEVKLKELDWKKQIDDKRNEISALQNHIRVSNSKADGISELSIKPIGLSRNLSYVLVVFVAGFFAFFITLLAMFRMKVNQRLASEA